ATLTENPRFSESTDPSTWRTMAESSTTRTFKTPESPGALAVRVSAKSRCLSELTFFPIHETRRRTATARGIASKPLSRELYDRGAAECTEPHRGPWDSSVTGTLSVQRTVTCRRRHRGFPHVRGTDIQQGISVFLESRQLLSLFPTENRSAHCGRKSDQTGR